EVAVADVTAAALADHALDLDVHPVMLSPVDDDGDVVALLRGALDAARLELAALELLGLGRAELGERDATLLGVDAIDEDGDLVALLHHLLGVLDVAPAELGDVKQAVDAGGQLAERAELGRAHDLRHLEVALFDDVRMLGP